MFAAIFFLLITSLTSCNEDNIQLSTDQDIFFEVSHINYAWGKQFKGFIVEKDGKIRTYTNPVKWNAANETAGLSLTQVQENISNTVVSPASISMDELKTYTSKINLITGSEFSKPQSGGADRGITSFYAYRFDLEKQIYIPVLLSQTGDMETYNKDKSAIEISAWLSGLLAKVY